MQPRWSVQTALNRRVMTSAIRQAVDRCKQTTRPHMRAARRSEAAISAIAVHRRMRPDSATVNTITINSAIKENSQSRCSGNGSAPAVMKYKKTAELRWQGAKSDHSGCGRRTPPVWCSPALCHRRNLPNSRQLPNERSSDISNASTAIRVTPSRSLHVLPPIFDQVAELARCLRDIFRQLRPRFIGVDARYRLKQCQCEVVGRISWIVLSRLSMRRLVD